MRLDYIMYIVAGVFFVITIIASASTLIMETQNQLWILSTAVLGLISIGFGYLLRPRVVVQTSQSNTSVVETVASQTIQDSAEPIAVAGKSPVIEATISAEFPSQPSVVTTVTETTSSVPAAHVKRSQIKRIKGIGQKRAAQLNALGINSYADLANASTEDVAKSLQVTPKTVKKWVSEAKEKIK